MRDTGSAIDGDDLRFELHVALIRRHRAPVPFNGCAALLRRIEWHFVVTRIRAE